MTMLAAGLQVVGGFMQAGAAKKAAEAEAQAHEYNAAVAVRNKRIVKQQTAAAKSDLKDANKREFFGIRAKYAANGVAMTGSALDVMNDTAKVQALGVKRLTYEGKLMGLEYDDAKKLELMGASTSRQAGGISAAASILGGFSAATNTIVSSMARAAG